MQTRRHVVVTTNSLIGGYQYCTGWGDGGVGKGNDLPMYKWKYYR